MSNDKNFSRYLITAALPYANGPLHIGHMAGCFLPADIYVRYQRAQGRNVKFVCGADEHGVPITIRAMKEGKSPQEVVDFFYNQMKKAFEEFGISFDIFSRTSNEEHHKTAQDFFTKLYNDGVFEEKESEQYFDEEKQTFLADRYITGTCPKCGNENAYGDQCENCGSALSPEELINPKSTLSEAVPVKKKTKHWYFPLSKYEEWLKQWLLEEHKDWKPNVYGQCKSWLDQGLRSRAMTRDSNWGVKVPLPDADGKVMYVWFDAPIGYISATKEISNDWADYWQKEDTKLVHFIGKDNIVFHCIIFPAMLKAHEGYVLPDNVPANEFLNIEGQKVSTSRNWAVWVHEYLQDFPGQQDAMRYVLCSNAPEAKDNDFTWKDFQEKNNSELVATLGNFINRVMVLTHKFCGGKVPPFHMDKKDALDDAIYEKIVTAKTKIEEGIESYKFREALFNLIDLARDGNKYLQEKEPWKKKDDQPFIDNCLHLGLQLVANLAILGNPFLPNTSEKICHQLKVVDRMLEWKNAGSLKLVQTGYALRQPELLFSKIEDEQIEKQIEKLEANAMENEQTKEEISHTPIGAEIQFDDFTKIDLRVAKIIEATKVPKADKLLQLTLDVGFEKRTVLSGIAEHFNPEDIVGTNVSLVANLAPRKMRGIMSEGMVLMTEDADGKLVFVSPAEEAELGAKIL